MSSMAMSSIIISSMAMSSIIISSFAISSMFSMDCALTAPRDRNNKANNIKQQTADTGNCILFMTHVLL